MVPSSLLGTPRQSRIPPHDMGTVLDEGGACSLDVARAGQVLWSLTCLAVIRARIWEKPHVHLLEMFLRGRPASTVRIRWTTWRVSRLRQCMEIPNTPSVEQASAEAVAAEPASGSVPGAMPFTIVHFLDPPTPHQNENDASTHQKSIIFGIGSAPGGRGQPNQWDPSSVEPRHYPPLTGGIHATSAVAVISADSFTYTEFTANKARGKKLCHIWIFLRHAARRSLIAAGKANSTLASGDPTASRAAYYIFPRKFSCDHQIPDQGFPAVPAVPASNRRQGPKSSPGATSASMCFAPFGFCKCCTRWSPR